MSIPAWARKGVKVVCVNGATHSLWTVGHRVPKTGDVCTIVSAFMNHAGTKALLSLREFPSDYAAAGWDASRFRPLVSTKTEADDVATFSHHLNQNVPEAV